MQGGKDDKGEEELQSPVWLGGSMIAVMKILLAKKTLRILKRFSSYTTVKKCNTEEKEEEENRNCAQTHTPLQVCTQHTCCAVSLFALRVSLFALPCLHYLRFEPSQLGCLGSSVGRALD